MRRRAISRSRRRRRFRATAVEPCRGTISPRRGCPASFGYHAMSIRGVRRRRPTRRTAVSEDPRVSRQLRGSPSDVSELRAWKEYESRRAYDPSCAGDSMFPDPNACSCGHESHVCCCAAGSAACNSVSYYSSCEAGKLFGQHACGKVDFSTCQRIIVAPCRTPTPLPIVDGVIS